jgi:hypothetical protein
MDTCSRWSFFRITVVTLPGDTVRRSGRTVLEFAVDCATSDPATNRHGCSGCNAHDGVSQLAVAGSPATDSE